MTRKIQQPEPVAANLSYQQMKAAIPKLDRRIADLEKFDVNSVNSRSDSRIDALEKELDALLVSVFGPGTVEYSRYHWQVTRLDTASVNVLHQTPLEEVRAGLRRGISTAKALLESIKKGFLEELGDAGHTVAGKTLKAYEGLELHPANAVRWQVWTALLVYLLLRYLSYAANWGHGFTRLFTILRAVLWAKLDLRGLLDCYGTAESKFRNLARPDQAYFPGFL